MDFYQTNVYMQVSYYALCVVKAMSFFSFCSRSRLGCQIILSKDMDGMTVTVPDGVADARDV